MALRSLASGGVYICGGILPKARGAVRGRVCFAVLQRDLGAHPSCPALHPACPLPSPAGLRSLSGSRRGACWRHSYGAPPASTTRRAARGGAAGLLLGSALRCDGMHGSHCLAAVVCPASPRTLHAPPFTLPGPRTLCTHRCSRTPPCSWSSRRRWACWAHASAPSTLHASCCTATAQRRPRPTPPPAELIGGRRRPAPADPAGTSILSVDRSLFRRSAVFSLTFCTAPS